MDFGRMLGLAGVWGSEQLPEKMGLDLATHWELVLS